MQVSTSLEPGNINLHKILYIPVSTTQNQL